jgi:F0F1-type ATP synthase assembly protein I
MADFRPHEGDPKRSGPAGGAGRYLGAGFQFAAAILFFVFVGQWLDSRFGTGPWLLLVGVFVGAAAGFHSLYRQLVTTPREQGRPGGGRKSD